jgi:hypothetical protein
MSPATELKPRQMVTKPEHVELDDRIHRNDVIRVKFKDNLPIRASNGALTDLGTGALAEAAEVLTTLSGGRWERSYAMPEARLDELRTTAQRNLGRITADLKLQFKLHLPKEADAAAVIDALNALECVELAWPAPKPPASPVSPDDLQGQQGHLQTYDGIGAEEMWSIPGGTGSNVRIADIEFQWNLDHWDLQKNPPITVLNPPLYDPSPSWDPLRETNHGTAVLGVLGAEPNGGGTIGIAYDSGLHVVSPMMSADPSDWDVAEAILIVLDLMTAVPEPEWEAGDIILLEQQTWGPNWTGDPPDFGYVPIEWEPDVYDAVQTAVGNNVIVVEAAGNGTQDLDDPVYNTGHAPFLPQNDSGAIIVGAGTAPHDYFSWYSRRRQGYSNHGSTVDLQGWGERVVTTGYGDLYKDPYDPDDIDYWYTATFAGTSSASAVVAGACAVLSSAYEEAAGQPLTPAQAKWYLRQTGIPQRLGDDMSTDWIGPLPDLPLAYRAITWSGGYRLYVKTDATGANTGTTWQDAMTDLEAALRLARACPGIVQVWVAAGTYTPDSGTGDRDGSFQLTSGVAVYGGFAGGETSLEHRAPSSNVTVLSGDLNGDDQPDFQNRLDNSYHVVTARGCDTTAILDGFTIRGGAANIADCRVRGGGIFNMGGSPVVANCILEDNLGGFYGGGMYNDGGSPQIWSCNFIGNYAGEGGGMYNTSSDATLINCTFIGNTGYNGAGVYNDNSNPTLTNCIFSGNGSTSTSYGGGMYNTHSDPTITNCTFTNNQAVLHPALGGAIYNDASSPTITNCILWGNMEEEISGDPALATYSDVQGGYAGEGNIDDDPLFIDVDGPDDVAGTEDDDLRLPSGSPGVDAGDLYADTDAQTPGVQPLPSVDLDGRPRCADDPLTPDSGNGPPPVVDMGAYEYQLPSDLDADGDVDLDDYGMFFDCFGDPGGCPPEQGEQADIDNDGDVDLKDFATFQQEFTG